MGFFDFWKRKEANSDAIDNKGESDDYRITIRYKYGSYDPNCTHEGCVRLFELNRYYSREEIQKMSMRVGHDVFNCGFSGDCGHRFKPAKVKIKASDL